MLRKAVLFMTVAYAGLVGWRSTVIFHRDSTRSPFDDTVHIPSDAVYADQAERAREAKHGAIEAFVIGLPWALVLPPGTMSEYALVLLLNIATVFVISEWLFGALHRIPKWRTSALPPLSDNAT